MHIDDDNKIEKQHAKAASIHTIVGRERERGEAILV
jgi:hypothetical protein